MFDMSIDLVIHYYVCADGIHAEKPSLSLIKYSSLKPNATEDIHFYISCK